MSTSSGWKIAPFLICHQEMRNSYFWGSFIMENRISNSCLSNQIPQGVGPVAIQKPGIRLKTNFLGGMGSRFFFF